MLEQLNKWDRELFVFLNNLGIESYDAFWIFVTNSKHWNPLYLLFFIFFLLCFIGRKQFSLQFFWWYPLLPQWDLHFW